MKATDALSSLNAAIKSGRLPCSRGELVITGVRMGEGGNALALPTTVSGVPAVAKVLKEPLGPRLSDKQIRFSREYERLVVLPPHPNVVQLFHDDVLQTREGFRFALIVMERCKGNLRTLLEPSDCTPSTLLEIASSLGSALDYIHSKGIVHRDLKSENVLMREGGEIVLADFGIAHFSDDSQDLTQSGDILANRMFPAPEQLERGGAVGPSTDLYALGKLLYWIATHKVIGGPGWSPLADGNPEYAVIDRLVSILVRQNPKDRPASAALAISAARNSVLSARTVPAPMPIPKQTFFQIVSANLRRFERKSSQSEAKVNLSGIFTACKSYFGEYNSYPNNFIDANWSSDGRPQYVYTLNGSEFVGGDGHLDPDAVREAARKRLRERGIHPFTSQQSFVAAAVTFRQSLADVDIWTIDQVKSLTNHTPEFLTH